MPLPLQRNSAPPDVAHALAQALDLHQRGRLAEAEQLYSAILAARPDHPDALHYLGLVKFANGQFGEALQSIADAMRSRAPSPQILLNYGLVLNALNRHAEAIESFDRAIKLKAGFSEAHNNRAVVLATLGRNEEALQSYRKAIAITPDDAGLHYNRGNVLKDLRQFDEAMASYDRAIALRPDHAEALCNRSIVLHELRRFDEAMESVGRALALRPDIAEAHSNRGNVLRELKRFDEALSSYDRALALRPHYVEALANRGAALHGLKQYDEAMASHDRALALRPDYAVALSNRGATLQELKRYDEAMTSHDRALALRPDDAVTLCNRGAVLTELRRNGEAAASYDRALALQPDLPQAHWNQATLRLLTGDFERGWKEYEWRWKRESMARAMRGFAQPVWLGDGEIGGKTILLHSEQGFGDTIQFCRYVPLVAARGAHVVFEVEKPIQRLMTSLVASLAGAVKVVAKDGPLPDFDVHCPLLSLPLAFRTTIESIPSLTPYLRASSRDLTDWQARLGEKRRPRIGLAWSGSAAHERDAERTIGLRSLMPLLNIGATFISLQKDIRPADAAVLDQCGGILDFGDALKDFADTAALISHLDLVISVDTSIAHLAGALAKPVWVLLPFTPDWRWQLDRADSPWYPTARLFRQNKVRTWDSVITQVREATLEFAASGR